MGNLIRTNQCSFIPKRYSSFNIIVAQEAIHTMRTKTRKKGFMIVKVDTEKAYYRLS